MRSSAKKKLLHFAAKKFLMHIFWQITGDDLTDIPAKFSDEKRVSPGKDCCKMQLQ